MDREELFARAVEELQIEESKLDELKEQGQFNLRQAKFSVKRGIESIVNIIIQEKLI